MTASLLTMPSCQKARFGISLKWMSSANPANLLSRRIRSMFFSTRIAARCQGTLVASRLANSYSGFVSFLITLISPVMLGHGTCWVSVQAREDFASSGEWFWGNRLVISNSGAAWQNPGGGFGSNCPTWGRKTTCRPTQNGPDQLYRLVGTLAVGTTTPAPRRELHQHPGRCAGKATLSFWHRDCTTDSIDFDW